MGCAQEKTGPCTKFSQLSFPQRTGLVLLIVAQLTLLIAAEVDIQRRSDDQVAGRKLWWRAVCLINFIGPLSYFRWGRRRPTPEQPTQAQPEVAASERVVAAP